MEELLYDSFGAVVPAYNEESHIDGLLRSITKYLPPDNILVIDDGSTDSTATKAESTGINVIRNDENLGKGASLIKGCEIMAGRENIEGIFTLDADGQHDPDEIPAFIDSFRKNGADIVIGSRMSDTSGMPLIRRITNRLTSWVISMRAGCAIEDSQSGYRLLSRTVLGDVKLVTSRFDTESEILIKAAKAGAVINSVSIRTIYGEEKSKINPIKDTVRFFQLVIRSYFW
jgi:glycosyltransferase involved in cell wall biosynthesis